MVNNQAGGEGERTAQEDIDYDLHLVVRAEELLGQFEHNLLTDSLDAVFSLRAEPDEFVRHLHDHHGQLPHCIPLPFDLGWFEIRDLQTGYTPGGLPAVGVHCNYVYSQGSLEQPDRKFSLNIDRALGVGVVFTIVEQIQDQITIRATHGHPVLSRYTDAAYRSAPIAWKSQQAASKMRVSRLTLDAIVSLRSDAGKSSEVAVDDIDYAASTARGGRPELEANRHARREVLEHGRKPADVYREWEKLMGDRLGELVNPRDSFNQAIRAGRKRLRNRANTE